MQVGDGLLVLEERPKSSKETKKDDAEKSHKIEKRKKRGRKVVGPCDTRKP